MDSAVAHATNAITRHRDSDPTLATRFSLLASRSLLLAPLKLAPPKLVAPYSAGGKCKRCKQMFVSVARAPAVTADDSDGDESSDEGREGRSDEGEKEDVGAKGDANA